MEDVARYRDGVGVSRAAGRAAGVPRRRRSGALDGLLARCARTHGPFLAAEPARRWGLPRGRRRGRARTGWSRAGTLLRGEFRPGGAEREWCDPEVLRLLRRRSLAQLRREVEPVDPVDAGPVPAGLAGRGAVAVRGGSRRRAAPRAGRPGAPGRGRRPARRPADPGLGPRARRAARPASPATSRGCSTSWARWARSPGWAAGASAATTAGSSCYRPGRELLRPTGLPDGVGAARRPRSTSGSGRTSRRRGASFYRELFTAVGRAVGPRGARRAVGPRLGGEVTNDTFAPLRALRWKRPAEGPRGPRPGRLTSLGPPEAAGRWSLVERARGRAAGRGAGGRPGPSAVHALGARPARAPRRR